VAVERQCENRPKWAAQMGRFVVLHDRWPSGLPAEDSGGRCNVFSHSVFEVGVTCHWAKVLISARRLFPWGRRKSAICGSRDSSKQVAISLPSRGALVAPTPAIDAAPSHSSGEVPSPGHELSNPSEDFVLKVLITAKISVTAAAPRCKHLCGFVDDKMEARPLAGMRPASGCGSIQRGNLEAL